MFKKDIINLILAFVLGVILMLLVSSRPDKARYIPFSSQGNQILDTRNGCVYSKSESSKGGIWITTVNKVGVK